MQMYVVFLIFLALLQQAVRLNENSKLLWKKFLEFEIEFAGSLQRRRNLLGITGEVDDPNADSIVNGLIPALVLRKARKGTSGDL